MSNINQRINERAIMLKWMNDTEKYLLKSIENKGLVETRKLRNSLVTEAMGLTTDVKTFVFKYSLHGMFVDMGLFGGKGLDEKKDNDLVRQITGSRKKKKGLKNRSKRQYQWFSKSFYGGVAVLGYTLSEFYGNKAVNAFKLPEVIEVNV